MVYGLTIGTERAVALQRSILDELVKREYTADADPIMAEYITIMIINNKTSAQITSELEDLIGTDFNPNFTDWLFLEAAKGASEPDISPQSPSNNLEVTAEASRSKSVPQTENESRPAVSVTRNGVYQQAISQALPSTSSASHKRTASARSPSPNHPNKSRRTDLPTGPRAMYRDANGNPQANPLSLLDRVGGPARRGSKNYQRDDIQARIDSIVGNSSEQNMMMPPGFPGMGMDMNAMVAANMGNPLMLQEMMVNQMALMAQMATSMGIINPAQYGPPGFPMQGVMPGDMGMFPNNMNNGFMPQQGGGNGHVNGGGRGRIGIRGGRGTPRGRGPVGGKNTSSTPVNPTAAATENPTLQQAPPIAAPIPVPPAASTSTTILPIVPSPQAQLGYAVPMRPQSPTLCKFSLKCTNVHCRYSHPSPVATAESGVVLSNEACEKGKDCKDKDCVKAHISPAVLKPQVEQPAPSVAVSASPVHHSPVQCRFGSACTRTGCTFSHPTPSRSTQSNTPCRFGAACTRSTCTFQHPEGRVLPSTFHRGLSTTGPMVNVATPETGSIGGPSPNRSVTFNNPNVAKKEDLEKRMKEIQEKKNEAEKAVKEAEAAASKKTDAAPVSITA